MSIDSRLKYRNRIMVKRYIKIARFCIKSMQKFLKLSNMGIFRVPEVPLK